MASLLHEEKYPSESNNSVNQNGDEMMQTEIFGKPEDIPGSSFECGKRINKLDFSSIKLGIDSAQVERLINRPLRIRIVAILRTKFDLLQQDNYHLGENLRASIIQQDLLKAEIASLKEELLKTQRAVEDLKHQLALSQITSSDLISKCEKEKEEQKNLYEDKQRLLQQIFQHQVTKESRLESRLLEERAITGQQEIGVGPQNVGILHQDSRVSVNPVIDRQNINQRIKSVNNWVYDPVDTDIVSGCCMGLFPYWK